MANKCRPICLLPVVWEKGVYKFDAVENLQLIDAFANTNVFDWDLELIGDADNNTAFGRSIQFRDCQ